MVFYNNKNRYFDPSSKEPFKLSRSKVELFIQCPRCFYLDRRFGLSRPDSPPFNLNKAVDTLLKKEFDYYRARKEKHPIFIEQGLELLPLTHPKMEDWRINWTGVERLDEKSNFLAFGAIDDAWVNSAGEVFVVDYKATSKEEEVNLDSEWQMSYKRQAEFYQWLLRGNNLKVSDTAYFLYCNGKTDRPDFKGKLEFDIKLIPYQGNDSWVEKKLLEAKACLLAKEAPPANPECKYCAYIEKAKTYSPKKQSSLF